MLVQVNWEMLTADLAPDERLIYPKYYELRPYLYDQIEQVGWLIGYIGGHGRGLTWAWDRALDRTLAEIEELQYEIEHIQQMYLARLRLPWNEVENEILITQEEFDEFRGHFDVISIFAQVVDKEFPYNIKTIPVVGIDHDNYEVLDFRYFVRMKTKR